jgi:hypothetical protein
MDGPRIGEFEPAGMVVLGRDELDPPLGHADALDRLAHAQALEQRAVGRQQRFADVKARVVLLLDQHHAAPLAGQQRGHGAAGRPAADDQHVAGSRTVGGACGRAGTCSPMKQPWRPGNDGRLAT